MSLCLANQFAQFRAKGGRQSISNLDSHTDFTEFDRADVGPVDVRALGEVLL